VFFFQRCDNAIPPITWQLRSTENNELADKVIPADGDVNFVFKPTVIDEEHPSHTRRLVAGSPDKVKRIFDGMIRAAKTKNHTIYSPSGDVIERWEETLATAEIEASQEFAGYDIVAIDYVAWNRGMFKIALGLGHLVLGSDWTFSASADCLRAVLVNERKDWPAFKGINPPLPPAIVRLLDIDQTVRDRQQHTLIVLPGHEPTAIISLFGGSVPQFAISLGNVLGNFGSLERMPPKQLVGFRVDPTSRTTTRLLVEDLCRFPGIL
jgi:hypothetical protein